MTRSPRNGSFPPRIPGALLALLVCCAVVFATGSLAAQEATITEISVTEATFGTEFQIMGSGFGTKAPKVALVVDGVRVKGTQLKAARPVSDGLVTVTVQKAVLGTFQVGLDPAGKAVGPVVSDDAIDIVPPRILGVVGDRTVMPGQTASVTVDQLGTKGVQVRIAGVKAKVISVEPAGGEGDQVLSTLSFRVSGKVPTGTWSVEVTNPVGGDLLPGALVVAGGAPKLGKLHLSVEANGARGFNSKPKQMLVQSSFDGPTTVSGAPGSKVSERLDLVVPFSIGAEQAPVAFSTEPALIRLIDQQGREWESVEGSFLLHVGATRDGLVAGSFKADLFPVEEGSEMLPVYGRFVYDGRYDLPDGGGETSRTLAKGEESPGLIIQILELSGNKGTSNFRPGDPLEVTFRMAKTDGTAWRMSEMDSTRAIVSGPTSNYQRVIGQVSDIKTVAIDNGNGTYTYRFPTPIPETYLPPLNDTDAFGPDDGELTGQPLLDGTYTLGMYFYWRYESGGSSEREVGSTTLDFLLGPSVSQIVSREVVTTENCNQCHSALQFHGGTRQGSTLCLMCHTAGSEDRNIPSVAGGTPGASVEFSVMVHKIHNGGHLPSVQGVTVDNEGNKVYTAPPKPYQLVGYGNSVHDYSHVSLPAWPNFASDMPRDHGYSDLGEFQGQERAILGGVTSCNLCHGDPDGTGPLEAPAQGDNAYTVLRRNTCGSCHDDWDPLKPYVTNQMTMPAMLGDNTCSECHPRDGVGLAVEDAHLHPLMSPSVVGGLNFNILAVSEAGDHDGDGTLDPGEKLALTFTLSDDAGLSVDPSELATRRVVVDGPTTNRNLVLAEQSLPAELLTGPQPFTVNLPMRIYNESVGEATSEVDVFVTALAPHWNASGHATDVFEQIGVGGGTSSLAAEALAPVNYLDVVDATGFARSDWVLVGAEGVDPEYLRIQNVEGDRLWFSSPYTQAYAPGPARDHPQGTSVLEVQLVQKTEGLDYELDPLLATLTETGGFGDGHPIVVSYSTDFVMPEVYPLALNAGPDLGERDGTWAGKSLASGTYTVTMWGLRNITLSLFGETNSYRESADGVSHDFLVGDANTFMAYDNISSVDNCNSCHVNIQFHGSNRGGFESCLACHATAGSGDRPRYVAPGAPATDGTTISFREMVHKIHRGADLAKADTYTVVGFGSPAAFPNNFTPHSYEHVVSPAMPEGTQDCIRCHGEGNSGWVLPGNRQHPTEQVVPVQEWAIACGSCHDSDPELAHMAAQSSPINGAESCTVCHGPGQEWDVNSMHKLP